MPFRSPPSCAAGSGRRSVPLATLIAVLIAPAAQPSDAPEQRASGGQWTWFASQSDRDVFIDETSVRTEGPIVRFRMRQTVRRPVRGDPVSAIMSWRMDCRAQTMARESVASFDASGAVRWSAARPPDGRLFQAPIHAGTHEARLYARLCPASLRRPLPAAPPGSHDLPAP